eukprot:365721-Chlamydomonas_euryale.AAC.5
MTALSWRAHHSEPRVTISESFICTHAGLSDQTKPGVVPAHNTLAIDMHARLFALLMHAPRRIMPRKRPLLF